MRQSLICYIASAVLCGCGSRDDSTLAITTIPISPGNVALVSASPDAIYFVDLRGDLWRCDERTGGAALPVGLEIGPVSALRYIASEQKLLLGTAHGKIASVTSDGTNQIDEIVAENGLFKVIMAVASSDGLDEIILSEATQGRDFGTSSTVWELKKNGTAYRKKVICELPDVVTNIWPSRVNGVRHIVVQLKESGCRIILGDFPVGDKTHREVQSLQWFENLRWKALTVSEEGKMFGATVNGQLVGGEIAGTFETQRAAVNDVGKAIYVVDQSAQRIIVLNAIGFYEAEISDEKGIVVNRIGNCRSPCDGVECSDSCGSVSVISCGDELIIYRKRS